MIKHRTTSWFITAVILTSLLLGAALSRASSSIELQISLMNRRAGGYEPCSTETIIVLNGEQKIWERGSSFTIHADPGQQALGIGMPDLRARECGFALISRSGHPDLLIPLTGRMFLGHLELSE